MLKTLEKAARECGELLLRLREAGLTATDKDDVKGSHFATEGDEQAQALGIRIIREMFPDEVIFAEEQDNADTIPANCTVFDPVDGTTNYYNGSDMFGVTLCTLREGHPQYGVLYYPADDLLIAAERGEGCFINGQKVNLAWERPVDKTLVGTDIGSWTDFKIIGEIAKEQPIHSLMAAVWGARELLLGVTGAYVNLNAAKIWDAAAGVLAVTEAGGVAYAPDGAPLRWDRLPMDWILAANDKLARAVLEHTKDWRNRR